jgi:hypothetical protein
MVTLDATQIRAKVTKNVGKQTDMKDKGDTACLHQSHFSSNVHRISSI